jgi:hypothetical protein
MSAACAASSAEAAWRSHWTTSGGGSGSPDLMRSATVPPGRYSMTMKACVGGDDISPMSKIVTTFGWSLTRAAARASRVNRRRAASSTA